MPQKPKFTKEEIVEEAFNYVRKNSINSLTARNLGKVLNSSTKPIFGYFNSMEELKVEVYKKAYKVYTQYIMNGMETDEREFRGVGKGIIYFAKDEPYLFQMLFMTSSDRQYSNIIELMKQDQNYSRIINSIKNSLLVDDDKYAAEIYRGMWVLVHGIATMTATGVYQFNEEEIDTILNRGLRGYIDFDELMIKIAKKRKEEENGRNNSN